MRAWHICSFVLAIIATLSLPGCREASTKQSARVDIEPTFAYFTPGKDVDGTVVIQKGNTIIGEWSEAGRPELWYSPSDRAFGTMGDWRNPKFNPKFSLGADHYIHALNCRMQVWGHESYSKLTGISEEPMVAKTEIEGIEFLLYYVKTDRRPLSELWMVNVRSSKAERLLDYDDICQIVKRQVPLGKNLLAAGISSSRDGSLVAISVPQSVAISEHSFSYPVDTWLLNRETGKSSYVASGAPALFSNDDVLILEGIEKHPGELQSSFVKAYSLSKGKVIAKLTGSTQVCGLDGKVAVVTGWDYGSPSMTRTVEIWDAELKRRLAEYALQREIVGYVVFAARWPLRGVAE